MEEPPPQDSPSPSMGIFGPVRRCLGCYWCSFLGYFAVCFPTGTVVVPPAIVVVSLFSCIILRGRKMRWRCIFFLSNFFYIHLFPFLKYKMMSVLVDFGLQCTYFASKKTDLWFWWLCTCSPFLLPQGRGETSSVSNPRDLVMFCKVLVVCYLRVEGWETMWGYISPIRSLYFSFARCHNT